jgi:4-hydroxy-3-polyprenylbenzoate decarboxylase
VRLVVGISGATGVILGVRLLELLAREAGVETVLVLSRWAEVTLASETTYRPKDLRRLVAHVYHPDNLSAPIASGSYPFDAMVVIPCSMKTLAAIRFGLADTLLVRAADVALKEGRRLVLVPRESPLSPIHLENMLALARMGVTVMPPMPAFYSRPSRLEDVIDEFVGRVLAQLGVANSYVKAWEGIRQRPPASPEDEG